MDILVIVNNQETGVPYGTSVSRLLELKGYEGRVSVWIDGAQLLIADYPNRLLAEGDQIKIIRLVAGG